MQARNFGKGEWMEKGTTELKPGRYRHFRGNYYEVIGLARHSETEEKLVVYRCLYGDHSLWVRPLEIFVEKVKAGDREVPRFEWCEEET
jgi:hypothetical protein